MHITDQDVTVFNTDDDDDGNEETNDNDNTIQSIFLFYINCKSM